MAKYKALTWSAAKGSMFNKDIIVAHPVGHAYSCTATMNLQDDVKSSSINQDDSN